MPMAIAEKGVSKMNRKVLSVSAKRQITIPQKFFQTLGFGDKAEYILCDNELVIRPIKTLSEEEFSEQILTELIEEGLSEETLAN